MRDARLLVQTAAQKRQLQKPSLSAFCGRELQP
jgi:hypothetical protein